MLAVEESSVAKEGDLMSLRAMLERQKGEIEQLGNFKQDCSGPI
jgi:hypothetical protein